jgi:hypothetical protein
MDDSLDFWFEYIPTAREFYLTGRPVDANADPMLAAMVEWLKKLKLRFKRLRQRDANILRAAW